MVGKAYRIPSATDRLRKQQIDIRNLQAQNRNRNTPRAVATTAFAGISAAGSTGGGTGNFLPLVGGTMFGNVAFDPDTVAVINGRIDLEPNGNPSKNSTNILVTGQGTPDDVRFIDNAERNGQLLLYQGTNQQIQNLLNAVSFLITNIVGTGTTNIVTVTVASTTGLSNGSLVDVSTTTNFNKRDAVVANLTSTTFTYDLGETGSATAETTGTVQTGNIYTNSGSTITLDGTLSTHGAPRILLIFDNTIFAGGGWRPATTSEGGGTGVSFPITPTVSVRGTVTTTQNILLTAVTAHSTSMTLGASISITFSGFPTTGTQIEWEVEITQDATGGRVITWPAAVVNPPTLNTTAALVTVVVFRTNDGGTTIRVANTVTTGSSVSTWANFNAISDINFATFDGTNIDRLLFSQTAGSALTSGLTGITSNASSSMLFNIPANTLYNFSSNAISILTLDNTSSNLFLALFARDDEIPILQLTRLDSTPTVGAEVGRMTFVGVDSSGSTQEEFGRVQVDAEDLTVGSVDGSLHLQVDKSSSTTAFMSMNNSNDNKVSIWRNLFCQPGIDIEMVGNDLWLDSSLTSKLSGTSSAFNVTVGSELVAVFDTAGLTMQTGNSVSAGNFVFITPSTTTILSDGQMMYDSALNKFRARQNGSTVDLISGSTNSIFQLNSNVTVTDTGSGLISFTADAILVATMQNNRMDFKQTDLFGIKALTFDNATTTSIFTQTTSNLTLNFPTNSTIFNINFNSVVGLSVDLLRTRLHSNTPNTTDAALSLFRDDPSPTADDDLGTITFDGRDSATNFTTYANMVGEISSPTTTAEIGRLRWSVLNAGILINSLTLSPGSLTVKEFSSVSTDNAEFHLTKEDASPTAGDTVGSILFDLFDSPTTTTYAKIQTLIQENTDATVFKVQIRSDNTLQDALIIEGNDSSTQFQYLMSSNGNTRMQPLSSAVMGYFVTSQVIDFSLNLGTAGSLQIPTIANGSPSVTDLNSAFGSFDSAFGYESVDERLYVRESATRWVYFAAAGAVT